VITNNFPIGKDKCLVSVSPYSNNQLRHEIQRSIPEVRTKAKQELRPVLTTAAIKDELIYQLSSKVTIEVKIDIDTRAAYLDIKQKYYELAEFVLYRINLYNPKMPPVFIINTSDLTQLLRNELEQLKKSDPRGFDKLVTEAVQSIMEGINGRYYHIAGLAYKVTWRFDP
jgi:hypothetical protein